MKELMDFFRGFFAGGFFVTVFVLLLFVIANVAFGDDTVREARLGEQDRSLSYKHTAQEVEHEITIYHAHVDTIDLEDCAATNARLTVSINEIAKYIKMNPKHAALFDQALQVIKESWCYDN